MDALSAGRRARAVRSPHPRRPRSARERREKRNAFPWRLRGGPGPAARSAPQPASTATAPVLCPGDIREREEGGEEGGRRGEEGGGGRGGGGGGRGGEGGGRGRGKGGGRRGEREEEGRRGEGEGGEQGWLAGPGDGRQSRECHEDGVLGAVPQAFPVDRWSCARPRPIRGRRISCGCRGSACRTVSVGWDAKIAGIEARGFVLGTAVALDLAVGFVPIRKHGAIHPGPRAMRLAAPDWRGNEAELLIQRAALTPADRVLLVDDSIETGSQASAARQLIEECGSCWVGLSVLVDQAKPAVRRGLERVVAAVAFEALPPSLGRTFLNAPANQIQSRVTRLA